MSDAISNYCAVRKSLLFMISQVCEGTARVEEYFCSIFHLAPLVPTHKMLCAVEIWISGTKLIGVCHCFRGSKAQSGGISIRRLCTSKIPNKYGLSKVFPPNYDLEKCERYNPPRLARKERFPSIDGLPGAIRKWLHGRIQICGRLEASFEAATNVAKSWRARHILFR